MIPKFFQLLGALLLVIPSCCASPPVATVPTGQKVVLVSESGDLQEQALGETASTIAVETHFGPGAAEFRVASLHAFELSVTAPSHDAGSLRFGA